MREKAFRRFLTTRYIGKTTGRPLSESSVKDALSRCRRIEVVLGTDLDVALAKGDLNGVLKSVSQKVSAFKIRGDAESGLRDLRAAARLYATFLAGKTTRGPTKEYRSSRR